MRLGAALPFETDDPEEIARGLVEAGYSAGVCPPVEPDQTERIRAIREAFDQHDVMLAELGVWNNMLDPDPEERLKNVQENVEALAAADAVGVGCCVNIAGSFNPEAWDGPHPHNVSEDAFDLVVETVRTIIDSVKPKRTKYALEPMAWAWPYDADAYVRLVEAIDRPMFGVHLDPVNMISSPSRYFDNAGFIRECFTKLGRWIVSCHGKDIALRNELTVHLDEVRPGLGALDYGVYLREIELLDDVPLILEHLPMEDYAQAREYVVGVAEEVGVPLYERKRTNKIF